MSQEKNIKQCKICLEFKERINAGKYPSLKDSRYVDSKGKEWNGHTCSDCHRKKVAQRKRANSQILKEYKNVSESK